MLSFNHGTCNTYSFLQIYAGRKSNRTISTGKKFSASSSIFMVRYQYLQVKMNFLCHSKSIILVVSIFCVTIKFSDCFHNDNFVQGNISDCTDFGECSQICENSGCSCLPGFKLQVDKKSCELIEKEWKLVFAGHGKIGCLEMDKHGKLRETSNMDYTNFLITEIEVDARKKLVYWKADDPETNMDAVYRSYLERPDTFEKVVRGGSFHPVQIAFDWITSNMYVAEDLGRIVVCRSDTLDTCGVLIDNLNSTGYMKHLALHPNLALLFWIDATSQSISRAGMDGTSPVQIIKTEQNWIQSIAVDQGNGRIYWIHMSSDLTTIKSSKLDGTDIKETISLSTSLPNLQGLSIFGDTLFLMMTFPKSASGQTIEVNCVQKIYFTFLRLCDGKFLFFIF